MPALTHLKDKMELCCCIQRKCNTFFVEDGIRGVLLDHPTYMKHQKDEKIREITDKNKARRTLEAESRKAKACDGPVQPTSRDYVLQAQAAALEANDRSLEDLLAGLSVQDLEPAPSMEPPPAPDKFVSESKYRIGKERDMAEYFSLLMNEIQTRIKYFESVKISHILGSDTRQVLQACSDAKAFAIGVQERLIWADKGANRKKPLVKHLLDETNKMLSRLQDLVKEAELTFETRLKEFEAEVNKAKSMSVATYDPSSHFEPILQRSLTIVQVVVFMIVVCQVILGFSHRGTQWLFSMCHVIVETIVSEIDPTLLLSGLFKHLLSSFPRDIRTATDQFKLDAKSTIYAVCTACHETYAPTFVNSLPTYPSKCSHRRYRSQCGSTLTMPKVVQGRKIYVPIKKYIAFDLQDWIGSLMSRTGYEEKMDAAWDQMSPSQDGSLNDIFQGSRVRRFKWSDDKTHFSQAGDKNTGRYLFSLGFDFFNPLRNLAAGKKISIGIIALICLNLPIEMRYKPENIFLAGIIPGPKEPNFDTINPYFKPIVDAFLIFWMGVYFEKTALRPEGRLVLCALFVLICDLPAARKASGFSSCAHEFFCSICWCTKTTTGYNNFDYHSWIRRTDADCRTNATEYRTAPSRKDANKSFDRSGLRCSEFVRLPYFDLVNSVVVDPMHNLFLGLVKEHFQNILGYGKSRKDLPSSPLASIDIIIQPSGQNPLPESKNERASIRRIIASLKEPLNFDPLTDLPASTKLINRWSNNNVFAALLYVAKGIGCIPQSIGSDGKDSSNPVSNSRMKKHVLAKKLVEWRAAQIDTDPSELSGRLGNILIAEEVDEIVQDIEGMVKPSWVTSIPTTISSKGPKLKSDQWRIAASLFFPVTFIRLWSKAGDDEHIQERRNLLHLTMTLFSAICAITSRNTSKNQADEYLSLMLDYRQQLQRLFPNYKCHPNHHMALHLGEFIEQYGPMHGWWTFPFERMIGTLQRISTNYHEGEYEETIARSWWRRTNLKALFLKKTCPSAIKKCKDIYERLINPGNRNSLASITFPEEEQDEHDVEDKNRKKAVLSDEIRSAFFLKSGLNITQHPTCLNRCTKNGLSYTTHDIHEGNSGVFFRGCESPFRIEKILEFAERVDKENIWLVVRAHRESKVATDPYARYPHLRAKLWGNSYCDSINVFPLSVLDTHFAKRVIQWEGEELAVCISLSRSQPV